MIYTHRKTTTDIIMDIQEEDTKQPVKNNEAYCVYEIHFITKLYSKLSKAEKAFTFKGKSYRFITI